MFLVFNTFRSWGIKDLGRLRKFRECPQINGSNKLFIISSFREHFMGISLQIISTFLLHFISLYHTHQLLGCLILHIVIYLNIHISYVFWLILLLNLLFYLMVFHTSCSSIDYNRIFKRSL